MNARKKSFIDNTQTQAHPKRLIDHSPQLLASNFHDHAPAVLVGEGSEVEGAAGRQLHPHGEHPGLVGEDDCVVLQVLPPATQKKQKM